MTLIMPMLSEENRQVANSKLAFKSGNKSISLFGQFLMCLFVFGFAKWRIQDDLALGRLKSWLVILFLFNRTARQRKCVSQSVRVAGPLLSVL